MGMCQSHSGDRGEQWCVGPCLFCSVVFSTIPSCHNSVPSALHLLIEDAIHSAGGIAEALWWGQMA